MYTTEAIILNIKTYHEDDLLVSFYTRDFGKLNIRARGVKKVSTKQGAFLHEPALLRCSFIMGKNGYILSGISGKEEFIKIAQDLPARGYVMSFLTLCDTLLYEGQVDENLWQLMNAVLCEAERAQDVHDKNEALWRAEKQWLLSLIDILGLRPQFDFSRFENKKQFDYYLLHLLQNKFELPISFFGLRASHNNLR